MRKIILLTSLVFFSSCFFKNTKQDILLDFNFRGKVLAIIPKNYNIDIKRGMKSELILMKEDSTIITKFISNKDGFFNQEIKIDTNWNPLILKIKGLENIRIDTIMTNKPVVGYHLTCIKSNPLYSLINIKNNEFRNLEITCRASERMFSEIED